MSSEEGNLVSYDEFREIARYALSRLDGSWFRAVAARHGMEDAAAVDVEVTRDYMERLGRLIKKKLGLEGRGIESIQEDLPRIGAIINDLNGNEGEIEFSSDGTIIARITNCKFWENIKKAGFDQFAQSGLMCSKVHVAAHEGFLKGIYPDQTFEVTHTKRIPDGEPCCEVTIKVIADTDAP